jgi:hypothetical protein
MLFTVTGFTAGIDPGRFPYTFEIEPELIDGDEILAV